MKNILLAFLAICIISCTKKSVDVSNVNINGHIVKVFHLKNKAGIKVNIMEYGATILNIFTPDRNGNFDDITAGYDSASAYSKDKSYFGCIVGRYANRIADGKFTLNNIEYVLNKNEKNINHLHGGLIGIDKKLWSGKSFTDKNSCGVTFAYTSPDGEEGYPGNLNITVTYTLNDSNELHIDYKAETDKPTVVNLSNHTYFNLSGSCNTNILEHQLQINADSFLMVNSKLIPVRTYSVESTPFDFRKPKLIGKDINDVDSQFVYCNGGYDHNFILNKSAGNDLSLAIKLYEPNSGRALEVYTDRPGVQIYSGNFLNGSFVGKKGCAYKKYGAMAIETQNFPDSPNHSNYPSTVLQPGQTYKHNTIIKFKVIK